MDKNKRSNISNPGNISVTARNLSVSELGGVIFGCKNNTIDECLTKQLFGLPIFHYSYVKKIKQGLPLFLFNYSDRKLHGIYIAASHGQLSIDRHAWIGDDGTELSPFPAQVSVRIKTQCYPLEEKQFQKVIQANYYHQHHFWFELDYEQTRGLTRLFTMNVKPTWTPCATNPHAKPTLAPAASNPAVSSSVVIPTQVPAVALSSSIVIPAPATVGKSWADLVRVAPSTTEAPTGHQEHVSTEAWDIKKDLGPLPCALDDNTHASLRSLDMDTQQANSSSSNATGDTSPSGTVADWEDLAGNSGLVTSSVPDNCFGLDNQTLWKQQPGDEELETDVAPVVLKPESPFSNQNYLGSSPNTSNYGIGISCFNEEMYQEFEHFSEGTGIVAEENSIASDLSHGSAELTEVFKELKERVIVLERHKVESVTKIKQLEDLVEYSERKIQLLEYRVKGLESEKDPTILDNSMKIFVEQYLCSELIYLIGGFNGLSWLSSLDSFSPLVDVLTSLKPMSCSRTYASAVSVSGSLYAFGGGDKTTWYDSVERYDPKLDEWTLSRPMIHKKGYLAGATLNDKIYAIGGGDGFESFSDTEVFDPALGIWIDNQSMLHKRCGPAATVLQGAVYAAGGFDGKDYLTSAERLDPRTSYWTEIAGLRMRRGSPLSAVFDEKLYVMGGQDGGRMLSTVEIYEPRMDRWMMGQPMNFTRAYGAAVALGGTLFVIGGASDAQVLMESVECYELGRGWAATGSKAVGPRSGFSAVVV